MKITIEVEPKEIAELAPELQNRLKYTDILEKQLELLSRTSEHCECCDMLIQHMPALTHAMIEISQILCTD